jgi:hypothetical protein
MINYYKREYTLIFNLHFHLNHTNDQYKSNRLLMEILQVQCFTS